MPKSQLDEFLEAKGAETPRPPFKQSVSPVPWASDAAKHAVAREAAERGDELVEQPVSVPAKQESPAPVVRYRELRWWESGEEVRKIIFTLAAVGVLGGGGAAVISGKHVEDAKPAVVADPCPPDQPLNQRSAFCLRADKLEADIGALASEIGTTKTAVGDLQREVSALGDLALRIKGQPPPRAPARP